MNYLGQCRAFHSHHSKQSQKTCLQPARGWSQLLWPGFAAYKEEIGEQAGDTWGRAAGQRLLTDTQTGHQLGSIVGHRAGGEDGLEQVGGEDQGHDVLRGGPDDEQLYPELEEGGQRAVHLQHVGIVPAGLGDGGAQLGVAQSPHDGERPADGPHHQRQPRRAGLPQHTGGGDEDAGADDGAHDDGHAVEQRDGALQGHPFPFSLSLSGGRRGRAGAAVLLRPSARRLQHLLHRLLLLLLSQRGSRARRAPLLHRAAGAGGAAAARHGGGARSGARSGAGRARPGAGAATMQPPLLCPVRRRGGGGERGGTLV